MPSSWIQRGAVAHFRLSTVYRQMGRTADAKRELEEYQKYKDMKEKLRELYRQMRLVAREKKKTRTSLAISGSSSVL